MLITHSAGVEEEQDAWTSTAAPTSSLGSGTDERSARASNSDDVIVFALVAGVVVAVVLCAVGLLFAQKRRQKKKAYKIKTAFETYAANKKYAQENVKVEMVQSVQTNSVVFDDAASPTSLHSVERFVPIMFNGTQQQFGGDGDDVVMGGLGTFGQ